MASGSNVLEALVGAHRQFLQFVERRVESRAVAEEILQAAFVRTLEKAPEMDSESAVAWFYRVLRNAVVDHYRRKGVEARALEQEARDALPHTLDDEAKGAVCACLRTLLPALKPEYAAILAKVDLAEGSLATVARDEGITTPSSYTPRRARTTIRSTSKATCFTAAGSRTSSTSLRALRA